MSSVEAALSSVPRPGLLARIWHWRYELAVLAGVLFGGISIAVALGLDWLIAAAAVAMAVGAATLAWPVSRRRLVARAWCVITPHRIRTGCAHAWVQTRDGRLPAVLYTATADFGERVWLWCRAGITAADLEAARDILRTACWASDIRVVVNDRRSHIVVLEVVRRLPGGSHAGSTADWSWPYLDHGPRGIPDSDDDDIPREPSLHPGAGRH